MTVFLPHRFCSLYRNCVSRTL
uniref:Uncharacterized protein n=1 Tax=Anguilla anguilla TaxID=7936 RepID=A0A0E9UAI0_ANGAN